MRRYLAVIALFFCFTLSADEVHPEISGFNIIAVTSNGLGVRFLIPFSGENDKGGRQVWEAITEPFYARTEDPAKLTDINLFSLCKLKITAEMPEQKPAHLKVDCSQMAIPPFVKIPKIEIVKALLDCIVENLMFYKRTKPTITVVGRPEDNDWLQKAAQAYEKTTYGGKVDFDQVPVAKQQRVKAKKAKEPIEEDLGNIESSSVLADVANDSGGRVLVRTLQVKNSGSPYNCLYRFEIYASGVLQCCETVTDATSHGKVTATWTGKKCDITLLDGWLEVTFDPDQSQHWTIGRRID